MGPDALEESGHGCVHVSVASILTLLQILERSEADSLSWFCSQRTSLPGVGEIGGSEQEEYGFRLY